MGICNLSPDSFSGDGLGSDIEATLAQAQRMVEEGADIIDIGGESTRPGKEPLPVNDIDEELRLVIPVIESGHLERTTRPFQRNVNRNLKWIRNCSKTRL